MKQSYEQPRVDLLLLGAYDVLTMSGDNDAPFIDAGGKDDDGWSGYH